MELDTPSVAESPPNASPNPTSPVTEDQYWFRIPDNVLLWLLTQKPAVIKIYLAIVHSCQKDQNQGALSERELSRRVGVSIRRHLRAAVKTLIGAGWIVAEIDQGRTSRYKLPHGWKAKNWDPVGTRLENPLGPRRDPPEKQPAEPVGTQNWDPVGTQTLESLESSSAVRKNSAFESGENLPSADDDRKLPRAGTETPEQEFTLRLRERHGIEWDSAHTVHVVRVELDRGGASFAEFLDEDTKHTTSPDKLTKPHGHYRKLARQLVQRRQGGRKEQALAQSLAIGQAAERMATAKPPERCSRCKGGGRIDTTTYCDCIMGRELARVEARSAAAQPVQVVA